MGTGEGQRWQPVHTVYIVGSTTMSTRQGSWTLEPLRQVLIRRIGARPCAGCPTLYTVWLAGEPDRGSYLPDYTVTIVLAACDLRTPFQMSVLEHVSEAVTKHRIGIWHCKSRCTICHGRAPAFDWWENPVLPLSQYWDTVKADLHSSYRLRTASLQMRLCGDAGEGGRWVLWST